MGRKLPFLPTCGSPSKTLSFRAVMTASAITGDLDDTRMTQETESSIESVIKGLSSDRFFFNPGRTSSILEEAKPKAKDTDKNKDKDVAVFKENVSMMEMESTDPFEDFKKSMQEMVEADEGLKQWDNLQELLSMYLSLNDKINHGYIIRAFVDILLVNLAPSSSSSSSSTSTSSSCSSSINGQEQSLLNGSSSCSNNKKTMNSTSHHESPESIVSFTSSSASTSETCSSTSHCLSSCSLEDDDVNHDEDDEDLTSPQKVAVAVVSDDVS